MKIYLGDLVYDTITTNYVVPLNVAYVAAHIKEKYRGEVDIAIFKYPKDLEQALRNSPPNVLGLSHYSWNARLDVLFIEMAKRLNPNIITVMGGPHIRTDPRGIQTYFSANTALDYYILFEGEEPFSDLVGKIIGGHRRPEPPPNCAAIVDGELIFEPVSFAKKSKQINLPSPYLAGLLDPFLANPNIIPLLETNRGCPFGCAYCTWGIAALSKVRQRPLGVVYEEIDYVAEKSVGQVNWIFCDANFGLLPRDVDIAKKLREVMDKKGYPTNVTLWHSKNTSQRNIEISNIFQEKTVYIAIQSTDPVVLKISGRGNVNILDINKHIDHFKKNKLDVMTDILIGLPGESAESHLKTLDTAFDMGFAKIHPYNIRMLPGSKYESDEYRRKYEVKTKYRPIFGAYGIYDGKIVFELEESIRATRDMTEVELDNFKVLHWLIYFSWNIGIFKPILRYGQKHGLRPSTVLYKLSLSKHPLLRNAFDDMKEKSMSEWFKTPKEMIQFYEQHKNFEELIDNFVKLNPLYIALVYQDAHIFQALQNELVAILRTDLKAKEIYNQDITESLLDFSEKLICKDLLQKGYRLRSIYPGEILSIALNDTDLSKEDVLEIEFYRPKEYVKFSNFI